MSTGESLSATLPQKIETSAHGVYRRGSMWGRRHPVTIILAATAILAYAFPSVTSALQMDFTSVASGQWWRLVTGHLTHYSGQHLFWDLLMFVVLGAACERQHPKLFAAAVVVMALGISATVAMTCQDVSGYRGLSGIDTGLFVWFIGDQIRQCLASHDRTFAGVWIATGTLLIGKLLFEYATGEVLFVDANGFEPLIESHVAGAAFGILLVGMEWRKFSPAR